MKLANGTLPQPPAHVSALNCSTIAVAWGAESYVVPELGWAHDFALGIDEYQTVLLTSDWP